MDDRHIILRCVDCEHPSCRNGHFIWNEKDGCDRRVSEKLYVNYFHLMYEVYPLRTTYSQEMQTNLYKEIISILYKIYSQPVCRKFGKGN